MICGLISLESEPNILRCADLGAVKRVLMSRFRSRCVVECFLVMVLISERMRRNVESHSFSHRYHAGMGSAHVAVGMGGRWSRMVGVSVSRDSGQILWSRCSVWREKNKCSCIEIGKS